VRPYRAAPAEESGAIKRSSFIRAKGGAASWATKEDGCNRGETSLLKCKGKQERWTSAPNRKIPSKREKKKVSPLKDGNKKKSLAGCVQGCRCALKRQSEMKEERTPLYLTEGKIDKRLRGLHNPAEELPYLYKKRRHIGEGSGTCGKALDQLSRRLSTLLS